MVTLSSPLRWFLLALCIPMKALATRPLDATPKPLILDNDNDQCTPASQAAEKALQIARSFLAGHEKVLPPCVEDEATLAKLKPLYLKAVEKCTVTVSISKPSTSCSDDAEQTSNLESAVDKMMTDLEAVLDCDLEEKLAYFRKLLQDFIDRLRSERGEDCGSALEGLRDEVRAMLGITDQSQPVKRSAFDVDDDEEAADEDLQVAKKMRTNTQASSPTSMLQEQEAVAWGIDDVKKKLLNANACILVTLMVMQGGPSVYLLGPSLALTMVERMRVGKEKAG